jgi:hypothetical protein
MEEVTPENRVVKGDRVEKEFLGFKVQLIALIGSNHATLYVHIGTDHTRDQIILHGDVLWASGQALEHMLKLVKVTLQCHTNHQLITEKMRKGRNYHVSCSQLRLHFKNSRVERRTWSECSMLGTQC